MSGSARLVLMVLLALAIFVPRAAWASHLAGHEQVSATATHAHDHDDHGHRHAPDSRDANSVGSDDRDHSDDAGGLVHDHAPAAGLTAFMLPPIGDEGPEVASLGVRHDLPAGRFLLSDPKTLQERPPRTV
jgi:hypothetical protein